MNLEARFRFHTAAMKQQKKRCSTAVEKIPNQDGKCRAGVLGTGPVILLRRGESLASIISKIGQSKPSRSSQSGSDSEEIAPKKIRAGILGAGPVTLLRRGESIASIAAKVDESNPRRPIQSGSDSMATPQAGVLDAKPATKIDEAKPRRAMQSRFEWKEVAPKTVRQAPPHPAVEAFVGSTYGTSPSPQSLPLPRFWMEKQSMVN